MRLSLAVLVSGSLLLGGCGGEESSSSSSSSKPTATAEGPSEKEWKAKVIAVMEHGLKACLPDQS